jgi:molybdenum cofactor synthesis domain-containing protein
VRAPGTAYILIIGDEILSGEVVDENAAYLARKLTGMGIRVVGMRVVPDTTEAIVSSVQQAAAEAEAVFVSGGIGPTHDDLTREAVARALGVPCERHSEAEARLRQGYGTGITLAELAMADLPGGARLLLGLRTGAFGFGVDRVHVLPGVPVLMREIFDQVVEAWEPSAYFRDELVTHLREGNLADGLRQIQADLPAVAIGSYPVKMPEGHRVKIVLRARDRALLDQAKARVAALVGGGGGYGGAPGGRRPD